MHGTIRIVQAFKKKSNLAKASQKPDVLKKMSRLGNHWGEKETQSHLHSNLLLTSVAGQRWKEAGDFWWHNVNFFELQGFQHPFPQKVVLELVTDLLGSLSCGAMSYYCWQHTFLRFYGPSSCYFFLNSQLSAMASAPEIFNVIKSKENNALSVFCSALNIHQQWKCFLLLCRTVPVRECFFFFYHKLEQTVNRCLFHDLFLYWIWKRVQMSCLWRGPRPYFARDVCILYW